ncbi:helix-turn-helix domain-containing protein [Sodalis sp. dw_96]|uniref:winged helix-turn-helix transcriptional regulator n=1 Tax=Sodalis sp. dw_96 TaxID=2719794 RepID=UPI001BD60665|nr:helix-turn-helix domain-containing protein [Sodalis sp. dw_96]
MKHKSFDQLVCPIARSLDQVGEWWSILILREAFYGARKFDEFQKGVEGIAPNTLTRRLKELVEAGIFERRRYSERPERYEYILTQCGRDFYPVIGALLEWGNTYFAPEGDIVQLKNIKSQKMAVPFFADRNTGKEISPQEYRIVAGPGATDAVREKIAASRQNLD